MKLSLIGGMRAFMFGGSKHREPNAPIPVVPRAKADYDPAPRSALRVTWLGHSTVLLEIDGKRVLTDPMWAERSSPLSFMGPKRYFDVPLAIDDLPRIDAVIISHDHYDHLDKSTVKALASRGMRWAAPLGVGSYLRDWGVDPENIAELDWWETLAIGDVNLTATPARHFSGRGIGGGDQTLWAGWGIAGPTHRVFYSGDTGLHDEFAAIGERLGPFDLTMIEIGEYNAAWADIHMGPEQAVLAHRMVRGDVFLPVHWGTFNLAPHGWTEPIERALVAAQRAGARIMTPRPGEMVEPAAVAGPSRWWPSVPWQRAEEAPIRSPGTEQLWSRLGAV